MKNLNTFEEFLNEAGVNESKDSLNVYNAWLELDAEDMESFFNMAAIYFGRNTGLTNMDFTQISKHLEEVHGLIKKRTGN